MAVQAGKLRLRVDKTVSPGRAQLGYHPGLVLVRQRHAKILARDPDQTTHLEWLSVTPVTRSARALEEPRRSGDDVHLHGAIVSADNDPAGRLVEAQVHPLAADP